MNGNHFDSVRPCPFCGKAQWTVEKKDDTYGKSFRIKCDSGLSCGALGPIGESLKDAVRLWNDQAQVTAPQAAEEN